MMSGPRGFTTHVSLTRAALPLGGRSAPGVGGGGRLTAGGSGWGLRGPVRGLALSGPVLCHLEGGRSSSHSGGRRGGSSGGGVGVLGSPVIGVTAPVLLAGNGNLGLVGCLHGGLLPLPLLLVSLLGIAVEEQVGHHLPRH